MFLFLFLVHTLRKIICYIILINHKNIIRFIWKKLLYLSWLNHSWCHLSICDPRILSIYNLSYLNMLWLLIKQNYMNDMISNFMHTKITLPYVDKIALPYLATHMIGCKQNVIHLQNKKNFALSNLVVQVVINDVFNWNKWRTNIMKF